MSMNSLRVLITACGAPGAPGIIKSLRLNGERDIWLFGTDMAEQAVGFSMVNAWAQVPPGSQADEFILAMLKLVQQHKIDAVLPLSTYELLPLAKTCEPFETLGTRVLVSPVHALNIANNKAELFAHFADEPWIPKHRRVRSLSEFMDAVDDLGYPDSLVCFKPSVSKGSRGFRILDPQAMTLDRLLNWKPDGTRTTLELVLPALQQAASFPDLLVMEYLPGREYSVDTLVAGGKMLLAIPRSRDETKQGICSRGRTEHNHHLIQISRAIVEELELAYNINLQFRYDQQNAPKLLEINPRVSGTIVQCTGAGVNMPYLALKLALAESITIPEVQWGTGLVRYWEEVFYDPNGSAYTLDILRRS